MSSLSARVWAISRTLFIWLLHRLRWLTSQTALPFHDVSNKRKIYWKYPKNVAGLAALTLLTHKMYVQQVLYLCNFPKPNNSYHLRKSLHYIWLYNSVIKIERSNRNYEYEAAKKFSKKVLAEQASWTKKHLERLIIAKDVMTEKLTKSSFLLYLWSPQWVEVKIPATSPKAQLWRSIQQTKSWELKVFPSNIFIFT